MEGPTPAIERLYAEDASLLNAYLAVDLSKYDDLLTYPAGKDWPKERCKLLFLQIALRLGIRGAQS
jgi:hypothetical protein